MRPSCSISDTSIASDCVKNTFFRQFHFLSIKDGNMPFSKQNYFCCLEQNISLQNVPLIFCAENTIGSLLSNIPIKLVVKLCLNILSLHQQRLLREISESKSRWSIVKSIWKCSGSIERHNRNNHAGVYSQSMSCVVAFEERS